MTEGEWLASDDPLTLLQAIEPQISYRKGRLYLCAGCRRISHLLYHPYSRAAIDTIERFADGIASCAEVWEPDPEVPTFSYWLDGTWVDSWGIQADGSRKEVTLPEDLPAGVRGLLEMGLLSDNDVIERRFAIEPASRERLISAAELAYIAALRTDFEYRRVAHHIRAVDWPGVWLVRDIFGNPFRLPTIAPDWLSRNNGAIPKLAQMIYDDRRHDIMPILGDALEDAGCTDAQILEHCRGPGPHVRGCWVVDLILGKE